MPDLVETVVEDVRWEAFGLAALAERAVHAVLARLGLPRTGFEVVLLGADDARISALNAGFRGKPQATNVLSFPSAARGAEQDGAMPAPPAPGAPDDPAPLGDIALAWETCAREAEAAGRPMADHVCHLIVHGTLHLLGFDHQRDGDAALMERTETEILDSLGVADPYS